MTAALKTMAAVVLLAASASVADAAPSQNIGETAKGVGNDFVQIHGDHRSCRQGRAGWHRHNRWDERRPCRRWHGNGDRPDYCVRIGPAWFCDF